MTEVENLSHWLESLPREWTAEIDVAVLERARGAYDSPGRHYHTWEHVLACVEQLRSMSCENARVVFLALVFHDAIYVAGRKDNEELSARLARDVLSASPSVSASDLAEIERLIIATKDHHAHADSARGDEATLLDIDLSILGTPRSEYARYAKAIHDEWVPAVTSELFFRIGRAKFLAGTLAAPHVYFTADARLRWDAAARANMTWEIGQLT